MDTGKFYNQLIGLISFSVVTTILSVLGLCIIAIDLWMVEPWANPPYEFELLHAWHIANLIDRKVIIGLAGLAVCLGILLPILPSLWWPWLRKYTLTPPRPRDDINEAPAFARGAILLVTSTVIALLLVFAVGSTGLLDDFPHVNICRAATSVEESGDCPEENKVSGLLLSRDSEYYYVLKHAEEERGLVEYVPLKEANNIQVRNPPNPSNTREEEDLQE